MVTSINPLPATLPVIHQNSKGKGIVVHVHAMKTSGGRRNIDLLIPNLCTR